jgi:hypothetical protein
VDGMPINGNLPDGEKDRNEHNRPKPYKQVRRVRPVCS